MDCFQRLIKWWSYWCYESLSAAIKAAFRCLVGGTSFIHPEAADWPCAQTWQPDHRCSGLGCVPYRPCYCCCCCCSVAQSCLTVTPLTAARQASLSITNSQSLLKLMSIESVIPPNHLILCLPLLLLPSIFPTIRVFSNDSALHIRWLKYWSFSFSISPSCEYLGLISFRIDWFGVLAVQGTLQQHCSKASILWCSVFFMVQLSHPYMTTEKTMALTRQTFVGKVMSLLFNMLSVGGAW